MDTLKLIFDLLKATFTAWKEDKASRLAAALAYYTVFSLAPLLMVMIIIAGLVLGESAAENRLAGQIDGMVGPQAASLIQEVLTNASRPESLSLASLVSLITILFGASSLFGQIQDALNTVWHVEPVAGGVTKMVRQRVILFSMVLLIGLLLLVSLFASVAINAATEILQLGSGWNILSNLVSFIITTALFAAIYKILPEGEIAWSDVWVGAAVTSFLFTLGKHGLSLYVGSSSIGSAYGAAGSVIVLLVWIYYSAQIFLLGAEFTRVYATKFGSRIEATAEAIEIPAITDLTGQTETDTSQQSTRQESPQLAAESTTTPGLFNPKNIALGVVGLLGGLIIGQIWRPNR